MSWVKLSRVAKLVPARGVNVPNCPADAYRRTNMGNCFWVSTSLPFLESANVKNMVLGVHVSAVYVASKCGKENVLGAHRPAVFSAGKCETIFSIQNYNYIYMFRLSTLTRDVIVCLPPEVNAGKIEQGSCIVSFPLHT